MGRGNGREGGGEGGYSARGGSAKMSGSCERQTSAARSHAAQSGWLYDGGRRGIETGEQLTERSRRSARMKLRKMDATSRSWGGARWRVRLVRGEGRGVSTQYEGGGGGGAGPGGGLLATRPGCGVVRGAQPGRRGGGGGRTWRKRRWKSSGGSRFHAMVSVMAVKIQLSSPSTLLRLLSCPGMRSISSGSTARSGDGRVQNHRSAILIGLREGRGVSD